MEELKNALKAARDALNNKDFDGAVNFCKSALKVDKNNYMALVILGVALDSTPSSDEAVFAFQKAITLDSKKPLAWQGLAKHYEKIENINSWKELIIVYAKMLSMEEDFNKYSEVCTKISGVALKVDDILKCGNILFDQYTSASIEKQKVVYPILVKLLTDSKLKTSDKEMFTLFQNVFDKYRTENVENNDFVLKYFEYLNLNKGFNHMFQCGKDFLKVVNLSDLKAFICMVYFEILFMDDSTGINQSEVLTLAEEYLSSTSSPDAGTFIKAGLFYQKMDYFNAYYIGSNLFAKDKANYLVCIFVAKCCLKLQRWCEAEAMSKKLSHNADEFISTNAHKVLLCAFSYQNNKEKCIKAFELEKKLGADNLGVEEYSALFSAYLFTERFTEASQCMAHLKESQESCLLHSAMLLKKTGKAEEAFEILNSNKEATPSCWFELGLYYWEKKDYKSSLIPFLQAARFDKYNSSVFLYLGEYNRIYDVNIEKAKKCFQKAFTLNPECTQAGKNLSYSYRYLQNWEANYEFLKTVTSRNDSLDSWAWLSLGLHHLALEEWTEALVNLRTFVRLNPNDAEAWESLADAYYSRGSLSSSLKCYQRAIDLDGNRKYSLVQIGTVQCLLGQFNEALLTYKSSDNSEFLPALIGMAEVKLCVANEKYLQNLFGCCRDSAQEAIDLVTVGILKENRFVCFWKVLSSAIATIARLPPKYRWLFIKAKFNNENDVEKLSLVTEAGVFVLAINCLCKAINLSTTFYSYLYHELAIVYLDYYKYYGNKNVALKAYAAIRKCLAAEKNVWQYWITLGVICMSKGIGKYGIAQHAFVQALNLDATNSIVWSNLGLLHLNFNQTIISNRSFKKSQQFDPSHLYSWIGQALIAESVGHTDAMDLFRHSTELGFHKESSLGYAEWVSKTLKSLNQNKSLEYSIKNMNAIPMSCDLMTWLNEYDNDDACCLNMFALLLEKMGLLNKALVSYEKALKLVDEKHKDIVLVNCGRTLFLLGKYNSAIEIFKAVSEASLSSACGLALSLYKCENHEESFAIYSTALQWLANNDGEKSELLVAMASMAYKFQGIDDCKTLLFQSVQLSKDIPSIPGLLAIYSIGLLHSEHALSNLVIDELQKLNNNREYFKYIGFFESYLLFKNQKSSEAIKKIITYIHKYPDNTYLWQHLSKYCLADSSSNASLASKSAQKVILSGESKGNIQNYRVASIAEMYLDNIKSSIKLAQMAIHMYPQDANNWALLLSVLLPKASGSPNSSWYKNLLVYIEKHLQPSKPVSNWLNFYERHFVLSS